MKKNTVANIFICLFLTIMFFIIYYSNEVINSISFSISIWKENLFPTLFPFFILSNLLLQYGFVDKISFLFNKIMTNIYHLPKECGYALSISLISGFPSGAISSVDLVKSGYINNMEASRLLTFTHYSNPLFILGFIGNIVFNNTKMGFIILISHITSNLIVGIIFKNKRYIVKSSSNKKCINTYPSIGSSIKESIFKALDNMFLLLGIVSIFSILTTIIFELVDVSPLTKSIISGILEMTQGVKLVSMLNLNILVKLILITCFISFGGLSVHMQVLSIISDTKIKYRYFFLARIIHAVLASVFVTILYLIF